MNSNYSQKQEGNILKTSFQNIIKLSLVFFLMFSVNTLKGQTIPATNPAKCGIFVPPGWTLVTGSTDISNTRTPGWNTSNDCYSGAGGDCSATTSVAVTITSCCDAGTDSPQF